VQFQDAAGATCEQALSINVNPSCGGTPVSINNAIFVLTAQDACAFGNQIINGICGNWEITRNTTTCITISFLEWTATICNLGTPYAITASLPYVSSGNAVLFPVPTIQFQLEINAVTVDTDSGALATDTPNPLVVTGTLPTGIANIVKLRVIANYIPQPSATIQDTGNFTILPLTHP